MRRRMRRLALRHPVALGLVLPASAGAQLPCIPNVSCPPGGGTQSPPPGSPGGTAPGAGGGGSTGATPLGALGTPEVGIEDENLIFTPQASQFAAQWRSMGVEYVRVQAYWNALSPSPNSPTIPSGFDPSNPNDPRYNWAPLDAAVNAVVRNGMRVMLTLNQSGPRWASTQPNVATPSWMPSPTRFAQFTTAVARRYGSRVDRYLDGSEPNQRMFLAPQYSCRGRSCTPVAPHIYRALVNASYPAIRGADPGAQVFIGELAPIGSPPTPTSGLTPLKFLQEMACVDSRFRTLRAARCRGFRAATGNGFGYHPYVNTKTPPTSPVRNTQLAKIGDISRLLGWLDRLTARRRLRATTGRFRVYFTEFGYISNPPNGRFGVSLPLQARYLDQSAYIVWQRRSRIKLVTQYEFNDDNFFQTGLRFINGQPKPSFSNFPTPFFVDTSRGRARARFWGQVRPDAQRRVTLQIRRGSSFSTVANIATDRGGYWTRVMRAQRGGVYRFTYTTPQGARSSQTFRVG
jgi:hypothetical protein